MHPPSAKFAAWDTPARSGQPLKPPTAGISAISGISKMQMPPEAHCSPAGLPNPSTYIVCIADMRSVLVATAMASSMSPSAQSPW